MAHCHHKDESRLEMIVNHDDDNDKKMMNWIYTNNDKKVINWKYVNSLDNLDMSKEFEFLRREYPYISFDTDLKPGLVFEMNGTRYKCSLAFDPRFGSPTLYFEKHLMKKWPMELHKYSLDLFRITNELEMILNVDDPSDLHESQIIKDLYLHNSSKLLDTRIVDEFFENVKVQNSLSINVLSMTGFVSDYSKIWNIPNVFIACNNWVHSRQLIRFKGKNAFFGRNTNYDITQDMNAFLKHWLNSDNTNLETMVFYGDSTNMVQLFDGIQTSRWDPEKRQARYVSKVPAERIMRYHQWHGCTFLSVTFPSFDHLDCTNAFDIVRESDGLMVSVNVYVFGIFVFVWHSRFS